MQSPRTFLQVTTFTEPVISLAHPYSKTFFHEVVEVYAMLLLIQPLLLHAPRIPILLRNELCFSSHFPLLHAMNIHPERYNLVVLGKQDTNAVVVAPFIITPLSHYCQYISRGTLKSMRRAFATNLSYWNQGAANDILLYHRSENWRLKFEESRGEFAKKNSRPRPAYPNRRSLPQGKEMFELLRRRYDPDSGDVDRRDQIYNGTSIRPHRVRVFYGNESLEETIKMFRSARFFIGAHGGGMTNIMFMVTDLAEPAICICIVIIVLQAEGSSVIEIRPLEWPVILK
jgi:hypothetical protein